MTASVWHDTPNGARNAKAEPLEAEGWMLVEFSDGFKMMPPENSRAQPRAFVISYSEVRGQYRAVKI